MNPYTGDWTTFEIVHLLRRCLYGPKMDQINNSLFLGLSETINQLCEIPPLTAPLAFLPEETIVDPGQTWVNSAYPADENQKQYHEIARRDSLHAWLIEKKNKESFSVFEKMCFFWHNHFAVSATFDSKASYTYHNLIETFALGNFKELVKQMTVNANMLVFLNGNLNIANSPNENFARELLELYTVGKGPQIAVGDYTNYTEHDISEISKILTGWEIVDFLSSNLGSNPHSAFNGANHDTSTKILSEKFNQAVIVNANEEEYKFLIDLIFENEATSKNICRKLYRFFVNYDISETIENEIIEVLALTLRTNNYEIKPVLLQLLSSEHFFLANNRGTIIKNPIEFCFSMLNPTNTILNFSVNSNYRMCLNLSSIFANMGQNIVIPPNVGGWSAYYQAQNFTRLWVNSSTLNQRFDLVDNLVNYGGIQIGFDQLLVNVLNFLNSLSMPTDVNQIIIDCEILFLAKNLDEEKITYLQSLLLDGLPDFEWTIQYNEYQANQNDDTFVLPIKQKFLNFLLSFFKLPEFEVI